MARINAKICLFFVFTFSQVAWLSAAAFAGDSFGLRLEHATSTRCYLFDHIELTQMRSKQTRPSALPVEKERVATKVEVKNATGCPAEVCINCAAESELSKVVISNLLGVAQWQRQANNNSIAWVGLHCKTMMSVVAERSRFAIESQLLTVSMATAETIEFWANTMASSKLVVPPSKKSTRALKASHRNVIQPTAEPIEANAEPIEEMPIKVKGDQQAPYWQYYEDCDRWGVEFSMLLKQATSLNQNDPFDETRPRFSVLGLIGSQNILGWTYATPRIADVAFQSLQSPFELVEFFWVETRDIDLEMVYVEQLHPITQIIKFGFEPTSKLIVELAQTEGSFVGSKIFFQLAPTISDVMKKIESQRKAEHRWYRNSLADQIDWTSDQLKSLAKTLRGEGSRDSVAKRDITTVTK